LSVTGFTGSSGDFLNISSTSVNTGDIFVIDSTGSVGIGTTSPQAKTHIVENSENKALRLERTGTGSTWDIHFGTGQANLVSNADTIIWSGATEVARFRAGVAYGTFGLGVTSAASAKFHTSLSNDFVGWRLDLSNGQTADAFQINSYGNTGGDLFRVRNDGRIYARENIVLTDSSAIIEFSDNNALGIFSPAYSSGPNNLLKIKNWAGSERIRIDMTSGVSMGIGTTSPDASSILDLTSTTQGALLPRMTTTERNAISSPANGLLIYNTTANQFQYYNAGLANWTAV